MPSLGRLLSQESDNSGRHSSLNEMTLPTDGVGLAALDCWRVVMNNASTSKQDWTRTLEWLCVLARSGVDIPVKTFLQFSSLAIKYDASALECYLLSDAALSATWLKSNGRQTLQKMFSDLHSKLGPSLIDLLQDPIQRPNA